MFVHLRGVNIFRMFMGTILFFAILEHVNLHPYTPTIIVDNYLTYVNFLKNK